MSLKSRTRHSNIETFSHSDKFLEKNKIGQHWEMVKALQPAGLVLSPSSSLTMCVNLGKLLNLLQLQFPQYLRIIYFIGLL